MSSKARAHSSSQPICPQWDSSQWANRSRRPVSSSSVRVRLPGAFLVEGSNSKPHSTELTDAFVSGSFLGDFLFLTRFFTPTNSPPERRYCHLNRQLLPNKPPHMPLLASSCMAFSP